MDPAMVKPYNDQSSFDKEFFEYILEKLIE
jgi:hypothetical protein